MIKIVIILIFIHNHFTFWIHNCNRLILNSLTFSCFSRRFVVGEYLRWRFVARRYFVSLRIEYNYGFCSQSTPKNKKKRKITKFDILKSICETGCNVFLFRIESSATAHFFHFCLIQNWQFRFFIYLRFSIAGKISKSKPRWKLRIFSS